MTQTLKNLSRQLISFRGNSGQTWHIPPRASVELPEFETSQNAKLKKLTELRLVDFGPAGKKEKDSDAGGDDQDRARKNRPNR